MLYLRHRRNTTTMKAEYCKGFTHKNPSLFYCTKCFQTSATLPSRLRKSSVNKRFVLHLPSFPSYKTKKLQGIHDHSTYITNALLLETFLFWFRDACELRLASFNLKHTSWSLSAYFKYKLKTMRCRQLYYAPNDPLLLRMLYFMLKVAKQLQPTCYNSVQAQLSGYFCASTNDNNTQDTYDCVTHQTTTFLPSLHLVEVQIEVQPISCCPAAIVGSLNYIQAILVKILHSDYLYTSHISLTSNHNYC